jgi:glycine cleavage system H protein
MSAAKDVKTDRRYTKEHEWAKLEAEELVVGITAFAVDQLGDITLVSIDVKPGEQVVRGKPFGTIESVKTLSDLFAPVSGTVTRVNGELEQSPELVNDDCWGQGWMVAIKPSTPDEQTELLDAPAYQSHLEASEH